ncbi:MAG TPA: threonine/serine dehydratase [Gemmatimonadaceae bacterium]|nr:threonine/serine dehydratase [Gemmatimonadaceae bacterium]
MSTPSAPEGARPTPLVTLDAIREAQGAIAPYVHLTPVAGSAYIGERAGARVVLKLELFQKTGSFKVRGVVNTLRQLSDEERARGVISLSAGNHAQALAWGARQFGITATIVMPTTAVPSKVAATKGYGGEVIQTSGDLLATALELQRERGLTLVHPFDDPRVLAGQGTVGLEILSQVPDVGVVIVACGGGGLISGVSAAIKQVKPSVRIIGVEPAGGDVMTRSLAAGAPQRMAQLTTIADGLAAPFAGAHTFAHCQAFVDEWFVVPDEEIVDAMKVLMERCKLLPEAAGAAAIVPLLTDRLSLSPDATVVPIVCGGNVDLERLKALL